MKRSISNIEQLKKLFLLLFIGSLFSEAHGQENYEDSLKHYVRIAEKNWHNNIELSHSAAKKAFLLISKTKDETLRAEVYAQYGVSFYTKQEYDSAIKFYQKALETVKKKQNNKYKWISYLSSALKKKGLYMQVFEIIESEIETNDYDDADEFNLLLIKLSGALKIGLTDKSQNTLERLEALILEKDSVPNYTKYLSLKGIYYQNIASYQKSDSIFLRLINHYDSTTNKMDKAETYLLLAQNAMEISRYDESFDYIMQSQAIYDSLNYEFGKANVDLYTGTLLSWMQRYNEASNYIFKALEVFEENNTINEIQIAYYELGWVFYSLELENRATKYLTEAIEIAKEIQNIKYLGREYNALGSLYTDLAKYDSALMYYDSAIYHNKLTKNIKALNASRFNKAFVLETLGKEDEALQIYQETYKVDLKLQNIAGLIEGDLILGQYYLKKQQTDSAMYYFDLGEKRALKLGEKYRLLKILQSQADLHSNINSHQISSEYLRKALEVQKQLAEENKTLELATLETTYNIKNKEKQLALLNLQKENNEKTIALNQKTIESQRSTLIVLAIGILALLVLSYVIFRYLKIRTKTNHQLKALNYEIQEKQEEIMAQSEELKEANDQVNELNEFLEKRVKERTAALENALSELDHFFYRASHDFRGPLTTLMGLVGISKGYDFSQEVEDLFNKVNFTVKKLDGMVKKLQAVSFLGDFDKFKVPQKIEIESEIKRISEKTIQNLSYDSAEYNCEINIDTHLKEIKFFPIILEICLSNLIENSIIFNNSEIIIINISAKEKDDQLVIKIEDNGLGISQEVQDDIFNMFKRSSQSSTGNGLGLYIVKKAINKLNGKIKLKSDTKRGSTFTLVFPIEGIKEIENQVSAKVFSEN